MGGSHGFPAAPFTKRTLIMKRRKHRTSCGNCKSTSLLPQAGGIGLTMTVKDHERNLRSAILAIVVLHLCNLCPSSFVMPEVCSKGVETAVMRILPRAAVSSCAAMHTASSP